MALRAGQASAAAMVQRGDVGRLVHGRPRQLLLLALGLCAAQPPPPAELGDGELCESGDGSVRDGLEALCCGGMRCIWNDVYPLQCSPGCAEMWLPAMAHCRDTFLRPGNGAGMDFFTGLCTEAISAQQADPFRHGLRVADVLCYVAGVALVEQPPSWHRCQGVDSLIGSADGALPPLPRCVQPLANAEGILPRLEAIRREQQESCDCFMCDLEGEEVMEAWDDVVLPALYLEISVDRDLGTEEAMQAFLDEIAEQLGLPDSTRLVPRIPATGCSCVCSTSWPGLCTRTGQGVTQVGTCA